MLKQKHFIDSHKGATALFTLLMMFVYSRFENTTLWIYLALHGVYGVLWILKSFIYMPTIREKLHYLIENEQDEFTVGEIIDKFGQENTYSLFCE